MADKHPFDLATKIEARGKGLWSGTPSPDYANMVGPFGGVVAALLLRAVLDDDRRTGDPVALTVNFCGGISQKPFTIQTKLQRGGKYTQHWSVELIQEDEVKATASVVMGARGAVFEHQPVIMPDVPGPETLSPMPGFGFLKWLERYTFRFIDGTPSFAGKAFDALQSARSTLWVSDAPERPLDYLSLAALSDCFFIRLLHVRGTFPPMGTVTLTTYFHATHDEVEKQGTYPLLGVADSKRFNANFQDQHMELWGRNGNLLASGVQTVWYKE